MKSGPRIRALVVEDEPLARQTIRDFVDGESWLEIVAEAADGNSAVSLIDDLRPDLLFLDIRIPGLTGLQVLERVKHCPEVIFTTAYDDYATTAFELEALDYILKPFGRDRFRRTLARVQRRLLDERRSSARDARDSGLTPAPSDSARFLERLFVRDARGRIVQLRVKDVTRLSGADDYVEIHANSTSYLVKRTLNEFEARLDPARFHRVHRSSIVNLDHVVSCEQIERRLVLKLSDGAEVTASRSGSLKLRPLFV